VLESLVEVVFDSRKATTTVKLDVLFQRRWPRFVHLRTKLDRDGRITTGEAGEDGSGRRRRRSRLAKTTRKSRNGDDKFLLVLDGFDPFRVLVSLYDGLGDVADALCSVHGEGNKNERNLGK
jgi:hypothetical protein